MAAWSLTRSRCQMTQTIEVLVVELTNPLCRRQRRGNRRKATRKVKERKLQTLQAAVELGNRRTPDREDGWIRPGKFQPKKTIAGVLKREKQLKKLQRAS